MENKVLIVFRITILLLILPFENVVYSQNFKITKANVEFRGGYRNVSVDKETIGESTGFRGDYLFVNFSGDISDKWHFDFRQRLNRSVSDESYFDGTDKALIRFTPNEKWRFDFGKRCVAIGGCDFAILPINLYFTGQYCDLLALYQWGASVSFNTQSDAFKFEVVQSPFRKYSSNRNVYGYNLLWEGTHGCVDFIHSVNLFEVAPGSFVNWIMLGHRFNIGDFSLEADVLNKYSIPGHGVKSSRFFFEDYSLVGKLIYRPTEKVNLAVKYCYDKNKIEDPEVNCDLHVTPGTSINRLGGIVEYYPLVKSKKDFLRLHMAGFYDWGKNTNDEGLKDKQLTLMVGATIRVDFTKIRIIHQKNSEEIF